MSGAGHVAATVQEAHRVAEVALSEAAAMRTQVEESVCGYAPRIEVGTSHTVGEVSQGLE